MIALSRLLGRLIAVALMALAAIAGAAAAIFCIDSGHGTFSLAGLASDIHLPRLRDHIGAFIAHTTAPGSIAIIAALAGLAAVAIGLLLLAGRVVPTRPHRVVLERTDEGALSARPRTLSTYLADRAELPAEVDVARARARARRRRDGGRVRVSARAPASGDPAAARGAADRALEPTLATLPLRVRVRGRRASRRTRHELEVTA